MTRLSQRLLNLHADGTIDENPGSGGGGSDLEDNKEVTIDVSEYTQPVEIEPTAGKDGMKKATVTLSNIPSPAGVSKFFCWRCDNSPEYYKYAYTTTDSPSIETKYVANGESGETSPISSYSIAEVGDGYFVSEYQDRYERYSDGDI